MAAAVDYGAILAYITGAILLLLAGRILFVPLKVAVKLAMNIFLGAAAIFLFNLLAGLLGFHIAFNFYTSFIAGTLGIPGFILLIAMKLLL